jgi:hypothetical protein
MVLVSLGESAVLVVPSINCPVVKDFSRARGHPFLARDVDHI